MRIVRIPLHSRKFPNLSAIVDENDAHLVEDYRWNVDPSITSDGETKFYARTYIRSESGERVFTQMHRLLLGLPDGYIDHKNGNGLDNRRVNLRPCSNSQNQANRHRLSSNTSGFRGVTWNKNSQKWQASIKYQQRSFYLGLFDQIEDAARAYDAKARELFGEFANINFPDEERAA